MSLPHVVIHTDGSYRPQYDRGGWSGLMQCGPYYQMIYGNLDHTSISRMELSAVINCLSLLNVPCQVTLYSDSKYVVNGFSQWIYNWQSNGWKTCSRKPVEHQDLWQAAIRLKSIHKIKIIHVKGHNGHYENELADYLARYASSQPV